MTNFSSALTAIFDQGAEQRMDLAEERAAIAAAQLGDEGAKFQLMLAYAAALRNGVALYTRAYATTQQTADLEDVKSQAVMGFLEAINAFDPDKHQRLAAIVTEYVRNAVSVSARSTVQFTVPERSLKRFFGIMRAAGGNVFEAAAIAPQYEMKRETFLSILTAVRNVESYDVDDTFHGDPDEGMLSRRDSARPLWDGADADSEDSVLVEVALGSVTDLEADVCRLAYGFADYEPCSDDEVGMRLGFSRAKAQRTRSAGLATMRNALGVA